MGPLHKGYTHISFVGGGQIACSTLEFFQHLRFGDVMMDSIFRVRLCVRPGIREVLEAFIVYDFRAGLSHYTPQGDMLSP
jgi:hypothetical protein